MRASAVVPIRFSRRQAVFSVGLVLLLVIAVGFQFLQKLEEAPAVVSHVRLAEVIPKVLPRWVVTDLPLGLSEATSQSALKTLNLDDYVYRRFQRGEVWYTIYSAHWDRGRMPTRLVASHTPDRCWTENGMRCVEMRYRQNYDLEGEALQPGEYRAFVAPGGVDTTYVLYWHLVEKRVYDYGGRFNAIPDPWRWWKDTIAQAVHGSREQLFVRVASNTPINDLWRDGDFQSVMATVARLGLFASAEGK